MTVNGTDGIVKGNISRKSNRVQSEGSKVHRGMLIYFFIRRIILLYNSNLALQYDGSILRFASFLSIQSIGMLYLEIDLS
jgi:hypothetical protein